MNGRQKGGRKCFIARHATICRYNTGYSFRLAAKVFFNAPSHSVLRTTAFVTRETVQWIHHEGSIRRLITL